MIVREPADALIGIPVLLYHSIATAPGDRWAVSPGLFGEHMAALVEAQAHSLSFGQYAQLLRRGEPVPPSAVVVTFDDGYADNLPAITTLLELGLRATIFVTTGWIGRPGMMSSAALADLNHLGAGVEVGSHAVSHRRLDELRPPTVLAELTESRTTLEQAIAEPVETFAYPHGAHARPTKRLVADAGYTAAAAVKNALSHNGDDPYAVARWTMTQRTTAEDVLDLLHQRAGALAPAGERARTRVSRVARRARRALGFPLQR